MEDIHFEAQMCNKISIFKENSDSWYIYHPGFTAMPAELYNHNERNHKKKKLREVAKHAAKCQAACDACARNMTRTMSLWIWAISTCATHKQVHYRIHTRSFYAAYKKLSGSNIGKSFVVFEAPAARQHC